MLVYLLMIVLAVSPNEAEFNTESVSIKASIQSNIFSYEVTNLSNTLITAVELKEHAAYNFKVPEGWQKEIKKGIFRSWVDGSAAGILPQEKAEFSMQVSSRGAVLSKSPVKIQFDSRQIVTVADVWSPAPEPTSYILFIAGVMASLYLFHCFLVNKKAKKTSAANG